MLNFNILHEIGEYFGQHIRTDGLGNRVGVEDFSQSLRNNAGNIDFDNLNDAILPQNTNQNPFFAGILAKKYLGSRYYGWQRKIISHLEGGRKNDVYVVAPPGGGKTTPLMAHYVINMLLRGRNGDFASLNAGEIFSSNRIRGNNQTVNLWSDIFVALLTSKYMNGDRIPRVLFITPIRVLALEQGEGFQDIFIDLFIFLKSLFLSLPQVVHDRYRNNDFRSFLSSNAIKNSHFILIRIVANILNKIQNIKVPNSDQYLYQLLMDTSENGFSQYDAYVRQKTSRMVSVNTGGGSGGFEGDISSAPAIIATAGSAKNQIDRIADTVDFIVYDEAHLYQPFGIDSGRSQGSEIQNASDCYKIINAVCKSNTQVAFLSGTIHPTSAKNLANFLKIRYNRNIEVIATEKGDNESKNKTTLKVIPDDSLRDENKIVQYIVTWINQGATGNAVLLFSKAKIKRILDKVLSKISPKTQQSSEQPRAARERIERYRRELKYSGRSPQEIENEIREFTRRNYPTTQGEMIDRIKNKPGASAIENNELKNAVSFGIGYIFTQDDKDLSAEDRAAGKEKISERDKLIVADLFSKQKINVLLATPSIGVGVNVSIVNMYLPTLLKFEGNPGGFGGNMELINKRELSQLINRAGRGVTDISGIYTPQEFVTYVRDIINMGNDNYDVVPAITISTKDDLVLAIARLQEAGSNRAKEIYGKMKSSYSTVGSVKDKVKNFLKRYYINIMPSKYDPFDIPEIVERERKEIEKKLNELREIRDTTADVTRILNAGNNAVLERLNTLMNEQNNLRQIYNRMENIIQNNHLRQQPQQILDFARERKYAVIGMLINYQSEFVVFVSELDRRATEMISAMEMELQNNPSDMKKRDYTLKIKELKELKKTLEKNYSSVWSDKQKAIRRLIDNIKNLDSTLVALNQQMAMLNQQTNADEIRRIRQSINEITRSKEKLRAQLNIRAQTP